MTFIYFSAVKLTNKYQILTIEDLRGGVWHSAEINKNRYIINNNEWTFRKYAYIMENVKGEIFFGEFSLLGVTGFPLITLIIIKRRN